MKWWSTVTMCLDSFWNSPRYSIIHISQVHNQCMSMAKYRVTGNFCQPNTLHIKFRLELIFVLPPPFETKILQKFVFVINLYVCKFWCVILRKAYNIEEDRKATTLPNCMRGHHVYKDVWEPRHGKTLDCCQESSNVRDRYVVAVVQTHMKPEAVEHDNAIMIVRYLLWEIFCLCLLFLQHGSTIYLWNIRP